MRTERDDRWIGRQLSAEADQHELDLGSLLNRIMPEVSASLEDGPAARGLPWPSRHPSPRPPGHPASEPAGAVAGTRRRRPLRGPRLIPGLLAATAIVALSVTAALVPEHGSPGRPGTVRVEGRDPGHRPDAPTPPPHTGWPSSGAVQGPPTGSTSGGGAGSLPRSFRWTSTGPLVSVHPDATHSPLGIRDPSVVSYRGRWHVFATAALSPTSYTLEYLSFEDWSQAGTASQHYLDASPVGAGYRAAPQVFWFAPQKLWYLVYQTGNASYSTNPDISNPQGWSAPRDFFGEVPAVIRQHIGAGYWSDLWVICDATTCYLFSTDLNGQLYRSQTDLAHFPDGMSQPTIVLQDPQRLRLLLGSSVYKVTGTNAYLMLVGAVDPSGHTYYRSWTSTSLAGSWRPLADTPGNPFAGAADVSFGGPPWTQDIGQGELIRDGYDQTLSISPCHLRYVYQGTPWLLGMLTQTDSSCS